MKNRYVNLVWFLYFLIGLASCPYLSLSSFVTYRLTFYCFSFLFESRQSCFSTSWGAGKPRAGIVWRLGCLRASPYWSVFVLSHCSQKKAMAPQHSDSRITFGWQCAWKGSNDCSPCLHWITRLGTCLAQLLRTRFEWLYFVRSKVVSSWVWEVRVITHLYCLS